jgi:hypothetical protein
MSPDVKTTLPRRDFIILPLLSLMTVIGLLVVAEIAARYLFVESGSESCGVPDALHGFRIKPNCVSYRKAAEGPAVENAYNECGYRTKEPCAPPPAGTIRVAVLGSSTAQGLKAPYDGMFATQAQRILEQSCGHPVEFQNMALPGFKPLDQYLLVDEALKLKPDLVMMVMVPYDLQEIADRRRLADRDQPEKLARPVMADPPPPPARSLISQLQDYLSDSRAVLAAQHFLYQDRASYIRLYMLHGDEVGYLKPPFAPSWEQRLGDLDLLLGEMADKIHAAHLPFMLVMSTQRAQVALFDPAGRSDGVDPYAFGRRVAEIAARHDIHYLDAAQAFAAVPQPEKLFMPVDGHMSVAGHAVLGDALARRLAEGKIPAFAGCKPVAQAAAR